MKDAPFISIILTCYNYGHLLPKTLKGIEQQTFHDFELIFVDNGSTDNTSYLAKEFITNHPDISVNLITIKENQGLANGQNAGIKAATGKYLLFHDADDWMDKNTLELLANAAKENNADRVISSFRDVDENGNILQVQQIPKNNPVYWLYGMLQANLFKRSIYQENNLQMQNCLWTDAEGTLRFSKYVQQASYVFEPCYNYLVHKDSTSRNRDIYKHLWEDRYSFEKFLKICYGIYSEEKNKTNAVWIEFQIIRNYYSYIYQFLRDAPLAAKQKDYKKLHDIMLKYFPHYLRNSKLSLFWNGGIRMYGRVIVWASAKLERFHLMGFGLWIYHILSRFKYFQV